MYNKDGLHSCVSMTAHGTMGAKKECAQTTSEKVKLCKIEKLIVCTLRTSLTVRFVTQVAYTSWLPYMLCMVCTPAQGRQKGCLVNEPKCNKTCLG